MWSANLLFAGSRHFSALANGERRPRPQRHRQPGLARLAEPHTDGTSDHNGALLTGLLEKLQPRVRSAPNPATPFPRILDEYVVREFLGTFILVLSGFVLLMLVFTFFDLVGDILRNHIPLTTVGAYLVNLTPDMLYQIAPLAVLIAVLVTFGVLNRNSEIIAMKATGISLYRLVIPVVSISAILSISLFLFDQYYLPQANRRQEALRNTIKGRPPQTVLHPEHNWIFGQPRPGEPGRIFYYQFFDPDRKEFANLSVFEFDPSTFSLTRRIFAARVFWDTDKATWRFQNGWVRDMNGAETTGYREFSQHHVLRDSRGPRLLHQRKLQSQEMNFGQLDDYIRDLRQSGFDTMRLRVALWHKLAYPLIAIVMAVLAIPFALSMGRRGSLTAIAVAIGVALAYWVVDGTLWRHGQRQLSARRRWPPGLRTCCSPSSGGYLLLRTPT